MQGHNPKNLASTGETKRLELYHAKRMHKYGGSDGELVSMVRALRQQKTAILRYIEALPTEVAEESGSS